MMTADEVNTVTCEIGAQSDAARSESHKTAIILYSVVVTLYWMSQYVYAASLPSYIQTRTASLATVGLVLSMYGLCQAFVRLPVGICTDWLGWRKPFILAGLALTGIGAWVLGTSDSVHDLILGRAITGVAAGAWVPLVVSFSSLFPPRDSIRAASFLILLQAVGRIIASAANGPLNILGGYRLAFYVASGISVVSVVVAAIIGEQRRSSTQPSPHLLGRLIIRQDILLPSILAALSQTITWGVSLSFIPIVAKQVGGTDNTQGLLATIAVVMLAAGSLSVNFITKSLGPRRVVMLGFVLMFVGSVVAALAHSIPTLITSQTCLGLGLGFSYPSLMGLSIRTVDDHERTIAMGIHQTLYAMGMFAGPALSGVLAQNLGIHTMFTIMALMSLVLGGWGARSLDEQ
jgi:MFS family permease